jgi:type II secretory pathway predicted ATPase ExeA/tetratricopeptide (TPR) repeat protein
MYRSHYNLRERPFEISTDTRFLWMGEKHKEALAMLKYGVLARKGFLLLTGDVGTGKTTLVNALLESLNEDTLVANITNPLLEPLDFFNFIAASFGMQERFDNKVDFLLRFAEFLRQEDAAGKNVLLILDEAHRFSKDLLEQFRLLSNIELPERKLINMFLVGQNEFNRTLMSTDCRALRQRITLTYNIKPLSEAETLEYIRYRLKVAGTEEEIFHRKAVGEVYLFSQGYPRLINILCDHALLTGFVRQAKKITPNIIKECSQELCLMGDTIRISSSDFFAGGTNTPSQSPPPEAPPADDAALAVNIPGRANREVPTGRARGAMQQGIPAAETAETTPARGFRVGVAEHKEPRSRYRVMAGLVTLIALLSALFLQKDILPGTAQTERTASATTDSAPGLGETNHSVPPPGSPETVTLAPAEPLAAVKRDGRLTFAKPSPYERAQEEIGKGNLDQAVRLLEDAIAKTPADLPRLRELYSETLCRQAGELSDRGDPGAEQLLAKAVEADPGNKEAYFDLGKVHTRAKRYPEAVRAYRKAADLDDRSADTFFNLGFVYSAIGDYGSAEKMFLRVAALRPPYLDKALFNLAAVQCKQEKRQQCVESLEEALAENPNNQRARTYLSQLKLHAKGSR